MNAVGKNEEGMVHEGPANGKVHTWCSMDTPVLVRKWRSLKAKSKSGSQHLGAEVFSVGRTL